MVQTANSGHPGAPMGMAPMAHVLWSQILNFSAANPNWFNRDRFVLSNGHACALLYTMLHLNGYPDFPLEQIKNFRQLGSNTAGHPESHFGGIEVTTGPLGQGISNAVGLAIAQANLAALYNRDEFELFNNYTYVFCGDGCLMEGISAEAASLAGHLGLGRLIVLYDDNKITIDGPTSLAFTENVPERFQSYGWEVMTIEEGDANVTGILNAIRQAQQSLDKPTLISVKTTIGYGSAKQGTEKTHGSPLGDADLSEVKKIFGFNPDQKFFVPEEVANLYARRREEGIAKEQAWNNLLNAYAQKYPNEHAELSRRFAGKLPENLKEVLPVYSPGDKALATRQCSQQCLEKLIPVLPDLLGGSADLAPSNLTIVGGMTDFQRNNYGGKNIRFGVREHAMAAIMNGISAFGGYIPYGATFFNFIGYCQGAVTLSSLSGHKCLYIMTHDSIGLGEDGPTHQPVDKCASVRAMPNVLLFRPADGNETAGSYYAALTQETRPTILALSRQGLPQLAGTSIDKALQGAYVLSEATADLNLIIVSTGSEVSLCVKAKELLNANNVRIVSMPCSQLFDEQPKEYQLSVFPDGVPVLSVEAGVTFGWSKYAHESLGVDSYGKSGKFEDVYRAFGLTPENIAEQAKTVINFYQANPPRSRLSRALN